MTKYRIKKVTDEIGTKYYPQARVFGFLWWYNIFAFGDYSYGCYFTFKEAQEKLCNYLKKPVVEYLSFDCGETK